MTSIQRVRMPLAALATSLGVAMVPVLAADAAAEQGLVAAPQAVPRTVRADLEHVRVLVNEALAPRTTKIRQPLSPSS